MNTNAEFKALTVNYINLFSSFVNSKRWYVLAFTAGNLLAENHVRTEVRTVILFFIMVIIYDQFGKRVINRLRENFGKEGV